MSISSGIKSTLCMVLAILICVSTMPVHATAIVGDGVMGQIASSGAKLDGVSVPAGTSLVSPSLVETGDKPATLHFYGLSASISSEGSVLFDTTEAGLTRITVKSGKLTLSGEDGKSATLAAGQTVEFEVGPGRKGPEALNVRAV